jgi:hypothetical protein
MKGLVSTAQLSFIVLRNIWSVAGARRNDIPQSDIMAPTGKHQGNTRFIAPFTRPNEELEYVQEHPSSGSIHHRAVAG